MPDHHEEEEIPEEYVSVDENKISSIVHYSFEVRRPLHRSDTYDYT